MIFFLVVYFAFNMTAHYKSKLIYVLSDRRYDESIQTLNDIWKHDLKISIPKDEMPINMQVHLEGIFKKHYIRNCGTSAKCWNKLIENGNIAILISNLDGKYLEILDFWNKRGKWIRKLTPPFFAIRISAFLPKGHPFLPIFNKYLGFLMKFGFVDIQQEENEYKYDVLNEPVKLCFAHLKGIFIFWIIGMILGAGAFSLEYLRELLIRRGFRNVFDMSSDATKR
ncbi:hypothetical protein WA026_011067 [Henosepilachna vigintioctopunctata]|uniref:Uncharacterized protein n=1 Tax=Henosepilachna vigintioctopunctata TaxID=420089 RepID=A0AAW1U0A8_9CUCU